MSKILVTGSAGYIGSHTVKALLRSGLNVLALDNLSTGHYKAIDLIKKEYGELDFVNIDLADKEKLSELFLKNDISGVVHLAARIYVDESVEKPELYAQENFINTVNLVEAMALAGVKKLIFSSTAAVYGHPKYTPVDENHPACPLNPYAQTKLDAEKYIKKTENLDYIIFRFFNVGGSDLDGIIGKSHIVSNDIIENTIKVALGQKELMKIFGKDYPTPDGTAIRDFIHVEDVAQAHVLGLKKLLQNKKTKEIINLGSENGFSVQEIIDQAMIVTGKEIKTVLEKRREGDLSVSIASSKKAKEILGWNPGYSDLLTIIESDWFWRQKNPLGY